MAFFVERQNGNGKIGKRQRLLNTRRTKCAPFSTKRGINDNSNGKSFISFWIAAGGQSHPRNDDV
jgi:hypothetical protein